jgi:hypothetical protein
MDMDIDIDIDIDVGMLNRTDYMECREERNTQDKTRSGSTINMQTEPAQ